MAEIELLLDAQATIAESLLWEPAQNVLYWMDVKAPALYRLDPETMDQRSWPLPSDIGAFALLEHDAALLALRTGLFTIVLATGDLTQVAPPPFDPRLHRFNEGAVDAGGRFWIGTMFDPLPGHEDHAKQPATLSTWTAATGLVPQPDAAELHNGMAWSPDGKRFYLSHSNERSIYALPFDAGTGSIGRHNLFKAIPDGLGIPDGAAVDEAGAYWCALHGGGRLHRYAPDGELLQDLPLPVSQPTACIFGGRDLATLFIASASEKLTPGQRRREPHAGGLFHLKPGVRGQPRHCYVR